MNSTPINRCVHNEKPCCQLACFSYLRSALKRLAVQKPQHNLYCFSYTYNWSFNFSWLKTISSLLDIKRTTIASLNNTTTVSVNITRIAATAVAHMLQLLHYVSRVDYRVDVRSCESQLRSLEGTHTINGLLPHVSLTALKYYSP